MGACGVCKWVTRATGRNRVFAAALESSYSFCGIFATVNCRVGVVCHAEHPGRGWDRDAVLCLGFTLILTFSPQGRRDLTVCAGTTGGLRPRVRSAVSRTLDSSLRWNDGCFRLNDAYDQCKGWRDGGAMGSCRWFSVEGGVTLGLFANSPYIRTRDMDARFPSSRERRGRTAPTSTQGAPSP